ncbi:MAG TPA: hypothetical protein VFU74_00150 [Actinocrinis sp.]|nr:hypothetical protein [Actinocrinis sp.]
MADAQMRSACRVGRWLAEAGVIGAIGGVICWCLDKVLLGFFAPDSYGLFVFFAVVIVLVCVAVLIGLALVVRMSARARLAVGSRASWWTAAAVCGVGWLPWFTPDEVRVGLTLRLALGPATLAAAAWFVAVAAGAVGSRATRCAAAAALVAVAVLWLPMRGSVVGSATAAALQQRAVPSSMALTVSWPGYVPDKYTRVGDSVRLQYDLEVLFPCPDCGSSGVLTVGPATTGPCTIPMALADGRTAAPTGSCREVAPGTWARETSDTGCDVLQIHADRMIEIYEDDCPGSPILLRILHSLRPADSAEILDRT